VDSSKNISRILLGKNSTAIQNAITGNMGGMGYLSTLKPAELDAIAAYITDPVGYVAPPPAPTVTPAPVGLWNTVPVTILGEDDLLTVLSDGKLWFIKAEDNQIGYVDAANKSAAPKVFNLAAGSGAKAIAVGPDKRIWFTESKANKVGAIDVNGLIKLYNPTTPGSQPYGIIAGGDGNLWFTETSANKIGVMKTSGVMAKEIAVPTATSGLGQIINGLNNTMWFIERDAGKIGRVDVATGSVTEISLPAGSKPKSIALHAVSGDIWVTDISRNKVLRINASTLAVDKQVDVPLGKTPDRIMYCSTGEIYFTLSDSSKVGGIDSTGKLGMYKLRADDANDGFRAHDLIEETNGLMWFINTPRSAQMATAASSTPANTTAEVLSVTEATLDANEVNLAPGATPTLPSQNAGGGGCAADPFGKPDPTLPIMLIATLVYLRRKFTK
jgi:virginiamycin B lyase